MKPKMKFNFVHNVNKITLVLMDNVVYQQLLIFKIKHANNNAIRAIILKITFVNVYISVFN